jgi:hypothetical protein
VWIGRSHVTGRYQVATNTFHLSRRHGGRMRVVLHVFHRTPAAGTLSIMWVPRAILRLILLPVLALLIATSACSSRPTTGPGTIAIRIQAGGGPGNAGLRIDNCRRAVDPNAVLKTITIRDANGTVLADTTLRGRDARAKKVRGNRRGCVVTAKMNVDVQTGASYEITADTETRTLDWPLVPPDYDDDSRCWGDCYYYPSTITVRFLARGVPDIDALLEQGYRRVYEISGMWNLPRVRVKQIVKRDEFPAPAKVVDGITKLWLLEDLDEWWFREGRHAPN